MHETLSKKAEATVTDVNELVQHEVAPDRPPITDDVDTRAAALMARLAARVSRPEPDPEAPAPAPEAEPDEPAPVSARAQKELDSVESPVRPADDLPHPGRRMAAPPWQSSAEPMAEVSPPREDLGFSAPPGVTPLPPPPGWPGPPLWTPHSREVIPAGSEAGHGARHRVDPVVPGSRELTTLPDGRHHGVGDPRDDERLSPQTGWRRVLHRATRGRINPGASQADREQQALLHTIRQPLAGDVRIAVLSIKGGVGKTTTTIGLGSAFAMVRADRVIAVD
ncbi:MAG: secretion protein EspI, partial [Mycobacterium sp.]|nr:secretion protein EspI [Mycobacterium sp.]